MRRPGGYYMMLSTQLWLFQSLHRQFCPAAKCGEAEMAVAAELGDSLLTAVANRMEENKRRSLIDLKVFQFEELVLRWSEICQKF